MNIFFAFNGYNSIDDDDRGINGERMTTLVIKLDSLRMMMIERGE